MQDSIGENLSVVLVGFEVRTPARPSRLHCPKAVALAGRAPRAESVLGLIPVILILTVPPLLPPLSCQSTRLGLPPHRWQ